MSIRDTIKDNLINYWDFYNENFPLIDRAGNNDLANNVGAADWAFGAGVAGGVSLEPLEPDAYASGQNAFEYFQENMSIALNLWVKVLDSDTTSTRDVVALGRNWTGTQTTPFIIRIASGGIEARIRRSGGTITLSTDVSPYADNEFHMVTAFLHPGDQRLYVDGELKASNNIGNVDDPGSWSTWFSIGSGSPNEGREVSQVSVMRLEPNTSYIDWLYNGGAGRTYIDIAEGNFNGTAKFGSLPAKRVFAISKANWNGGIANSNVPIIESAEPDSAGEYEMRLPEGDTVILQSHAFEPESWRGIWEAETAVDVDDVVFTAPSSSARVLVCTQAGTTASSAPEWPSSGTVEDGSAEWEVLGTVKQLAPITNYYEVGSG